MSPTWEEVGGGVPVSVDELLAELDPGQRVVAEIVRKQGLDTAPATIHQSSIHQSINPSIHQSNNPSIHQSIQSIHQSINPFNQSINPFNQSINPFN